MEENTKVQSASDEDSLGKDKIPETFQTIIIEDIKYKTRLTSKFLSRKPYKPANPKEIFSFIPGTICQIFVKKGSKVKEGAPLLELEAMKMLNTVYAPQNGVIESIFVKTGDKIPNHHLLLLFK